MRIRKAYLFVFVLIAMLAVGCGVISQIEIKKDVIDNARFIRVAEASGFAVKDDTDMYVNVGGLKSALYVCSSDGKLIYQFFVFDNADIADDEFDIFRKTLDDTFVTEDHSSFTGDNFLIYKLTGVKDYHHLCAVDNTLFYGKSRTEDMDTVKDFAREFGYN
ncbi:hypothetical protein [Oribacterium sp. WCC10]|uniref:hypothetical protein n=1 Tax=Oribacterium sp. WCC10 TaxID=1855343 RepID=UPI0008E6A125|nr:hypothetical protein [Oribacterium sp. WCC10]SFG51341.1 hypothetical protein SAMN05216356_11152 [Oribacterium sp. WCC10]